MKTLYTTAILVVVGAAASVPALAQENPIPILAEQSGLSERKVRMVLGDRTAYSEYRASYDRAREQLVRTIGEANYERLLAGKSIELPAKDDVDSAVAVKDDEE